MRATSAIAVLVASVFAQSASAAGFERGDVLASVGTPSVIARFAPDGTAKGELADSAGAGPLCFDASGQHLIAPGTGLYDSAGSLVASQWATVDAPGECVADAAGNVFVAGGAFSGGTATGRGTIRRFDLTGDLLGSYDVDATGAASARAVASIDLARDGCTLYYDLERSAEVKRFDVCTGTQLAALGSAGLACDHLRVRPNGEVVVTCDTGGALLDPNGGFVHAFPNPLLGSTASRYAALDPDGSSFWVGSYQGLVSRFDIAGGQQVGTSWSAGPSMAAIAVYNPPPASQQSATSLDAGNGQVQPSPATTAGGPPAPAPAIAAPGLRVAHGRLIASGRSLLLDTGLRASCPAGGPRCRATVTLTVAGAAARAAARTPTTRVGTLTTTIAPGTRAKLVVRLNRRGAALVRRRRAVTIAARASIRAGGGPAVVRRTSVRVRLARPR